MLLSTFGRSSSSRTPIGSASCVVGRSEEWCRAGCSRRRDAPVSTVRTFR